MEATLRVPPLTLVFVSIVRLAPAPTLTCPEPLIANLLADWGEVTCTNTGEAMLTSVETLGTVAPLPDH